MEANYYDIYGKNENTDLHIYNQLLDIIQKQKQDEPL